MSRKVSLLAVWRAVHSRRLTPFLRATVRKLQIRSGQTLEDDEIADLYFDSVEKALLTHDKSKAQFTTHLFNMLRFGFIGIIRRRCPFRVPKNKWTEFDKEIMRISMDDGIAAPCQIAVADLRLDLEFALNSLSEYHRNLIIWRFQDGLTWEEIAERLGNTRKTVKSQEGKALGLLREFLGDYI